MSDRLVVQLDHEDPWAVVVEPNGYLTSLPSVLADLSRGGRALSVFWNVNAVMRVVYAEEGKVRREFDALLLHGEGERSQRKPGFRSAIREAREPRCLPFCSASPVSKSNGNGS